MTMTLAEAGSHSTRVTLRGIGWSKGGRGARAANRNVLKAEQRIDDPRFIRSRRRLDAIKLAAFVIGACLFVAAFVFLVIVTWNDPSLGPGPP